ncbi:tRNA lysidine(34) synthetase TilS [Oceanobacillus sp. M65]|uniref:tRNA lysidine(34) synthetase TilS n=1 Tax=Oceanobacillus sp. M65 TaxID=3457435 RepID=UPI003FCDC568
MKNTILSFIKGKQLLTMNATVLIGVSGGPDSMALLHFLKSLRKEWQLKLIAISVDHQLRGEESLEDLHYVKEMCKQWDIQFVGTSLDVPAYKETHHLGTQIAARELRYQFFAEQMQRFNASYLALGHHGDDQVETMLMEFVRSASSNTLSGIPVKRTFATGRIIRPFLCVTKKEIEAYCVAEQIVPRIDPSNNEINYTRNYFRKQVLPLIKEKNSNIHTTMQHLSETLQEDENFLQMEAKNMVKAVVGTNLSNCEAMFEINSFKQYPRALQRRAFHLILNYLYEDLPKNLSYVHEAHFFSLLQSEKSNVQIDFPHHLKLEKSYANVRFYFETQQEQGGTFHNIMEIPGKVSLPDGSTVTALSVNKCTEEDELTYFCSMDQVALPLHIRTRQFGDKMRWKGLNGSKKVKDIFIDAKIPRNERDTWPIVTDNNGEILWLIGLKKGYPKRKSNSASYIQLHYENGNM